MPDLPTVPPATLEQLYRAGTKRWQAHRTRWGDAFHAFVPADYPGAYEALRSARPTSDSFLELGSGVGTITVISALLGYDAAGIEIDADLVDSATELATEFDVTPSFSCGTFIPPGFQDAADRHDSEIPSVLDGESGYDALGRTLDDFDVVYAFHWPGLEDLFLELMATYGRPGALLLTYGGTEGFRTWRDGSLAG